MLKFVHASAMRKAAKEYHLKHKGVRKDTVPILEAISDAAERGRTRINWPLLPEKTKYAICRELRALGYDVKRGMWTGSDTIALIVDWSGNGI